MHVGTNGLSTDKSPSRPTIASEEIELVGKYFKENMEIIVSEITERGDGLKGKGDAAYVCLRELCIDKNIRSLEHKSIVAADT